MDDLYGAEDPLLLLSLVISLLCIPSISVATRGKRFISNIKAHSCAHTNDMRDLSLKADFPSWSEANEE